MRTTLERLRSEHHKAARLFADGCSVFEVSAKTGRTEKNIAELELDPTFVGLVQFYRRQRNEDRSN
jgi:hypothetical protein